MSRRPAIAVLSPHWESASEEGWTTRQVAGALSIGADVHVITPEGEAPSTSVDGVFTLHRLGTPPAPTAATRRRVLIEGIAATRTGPEPSVPPVPELPAAPPEPTPPRFPFAGLLVELVPLIEPPDALQ